jgi:site-specific DNA-methyltransferase (adenine-specific)
MEDECVDVIFADPPFNLNKNYPSKINDSLKERKYLEWTEKWVKGCIKILKPGGSLFIWNIPKWNIPTAHFLNKFLTFRDWIVVDIKYSFPIPKRLYPSHYSLLYFCKGEKPKAFHPDRLPMPVCPKCKHDLRDYGGYKSKMNPKGVNLADVWTDISPVRHSKYKRRQDANELPLKLLDRVLEIATDENELVFDPFGGAGTTYIAAEIKKRKWIGCEIGPVEDILDRFEAIEREREHLEKIRKDYNALFTEETVQIRKKKGLWTCESVRNGNGHTRRHSDTINSKQQELFEMMK